MRAVEAVLTAFAINVASAVFVAGASRVARESLGEEQERDLKDVFDRASAAMLVGLARGDAGNRALLQRYEEEFKTFFGDRWVAETLVGVALQREAPPLEALRGRFTALGFDPEGLTIGFDRAMAIFVRELLTRLEENASQGGSLGSRVDRADLRAIRDSVEELASGLGDPGRDTDELEQESLARCAERWVTAGLSPAQAWAFAANPTVGAPGPGLREELESRRLAVVAGEFGSGKSLLLDRLLQRAIVHLREELGAPLPVYLEGWEVGGRLRDAVAEKTRSLAGGRGDARTRGAYVLLDGAEEEGRAKAERLVREARILVDSWGPNTTVIVAGRPVPELAEDRERVEMPELTDEESDALIESILGEDRSFDIAYRSPASVREAVRRPLFAVLWASDMRERASHEPRSTGQLLSGLVERALRRPGAVAGVGQLRAFAATYIDNGGAPVPRAEAGTSLEVEGMLATGLISRRGDALAFSLRVIAEWLAVQAIEHDIVDARAIASDLARLERWRYPLAMAVNGFGYERVSPLLRPVAEAAPAFASQVLETGLEDGFVSFQLGREGPPMSPEEFGRRLREAMGSWVRGIGPLAPLIAPVRENGTLSTLGVSGTTDQVFHRSWYRGEVDLGDVVPLHEHAESTVPNWEWPSMRGVGTYPQAAWVWRYALEDLRSELSRDLKEKSLPISGGLLADEAAWDAARELRKRARKRGFMQRDPIPLDDVEGYLDFFGRDADAITFGNRWGRHGPDYDLGYLRGKVQALREAGEAELGPPWPTEDRMPGDPGYVRTGRTTAYLWEWFSSETLLERTRVVMAGALDGYRRLTEEIFPRLAPHMLIAAILPARLCGTLHVRHTPDQPEVRPYVYWYLDPLPYGSQNEVRIEPGEGRPSREDMLAVASRTRAMRPQAAEWISPYSYATDEFYGHTPATELAYEWLRKDLGPISWLQETFGRRSW